MTRPVATVTVLWALGCALGWAPGCASAPPRRASLVTLEQALEGPVARESARDAPEAFAAVITAAERARAMEGPRADEAVEEVLLELERAHGVARERRARRRVEEATQRRQAAEDEARRVETQTAALEAEARQREEARATAERVRAAASSATIDPASRVATARDLRAQAALLLAAAQLLGATEVQRQPAQTSLEMAERAAEGPDPNAALRAAGTAYTSAETVLRGAREARPRVASAVDPVRLTEALAGTAGVTPHRDARGVVAVLRGLFVGPALAPTARTRVQTLARVLQAQGEAPVRLEVFVGGAQRATAEQLALRQATALQTALGAAGVPVARLHPVGLHRPSDSARGDDRAEVVLVLPDEP